MKTPARFILALAGASLVVAGFPMSAAQADDVNIAPVRSTDGSGAFFTDAYPYSLAVLPDGSRVVVGSAAGIPKLVTFRPGSNASQFDLENTVLGDDHDFQSTAGISFDYAHRLWVADGGAETIFSYAAGFGPGITPSTVLAPRLSISGNFTGLLQPPSDVQVTKSGEVVVAGWSANKVFTYPANTGGNILPVRTIEVGLDAPIAVALDSAGQVYVLNFNSNSIAVFPANADSTTSPIRVIEGSNTQIDEPSKIAVDSSNNIYVTNSITNSVVVFAAGASGNVAPVKRVVGASTELNTPAGIALDADRRVYVANWITSGTGKAVVQFPTLMPFLKPTAARSIKVSGSSKSSTRTISWTAPSKTGGTPVTKYLVVVKKGSKTFYSKTTTSRSYKVSRSKLKSGTNTATITAYNKVGPAPSVKKSFSVKK